ncbi:DUF6266 family protein [Olivibacter sp. CPCC 100613]|uniref:DUF6266 family protein n=1 Tax=Olivibacter sp. CPCC 100613 TaxID=3079931 RepID=UPI002FF477F3
MAIMKGGRLYGRVGDQLFYVRNGVQCVRSVKKKARSNKPISDIRAKQVARMKAAMRFLVPLKSIIYNTCRPYNERMTGMNRAVQQVIREALVNSEGGPYVDPTKVKVSRGRSGDLYLETVQLVNSHLKLQWADNFRFSNHQQLFLVAYNVEQELVQLSEGHPLGDKQLEVALQDAILDGTFHLYYYLSDRLSKTYSESRYVGAFSGLVES